MRSVGSGVFAYWALFAFSMAGILVPDLLAHGFLDDRRLVRMIALPCLLASATMLISYHTRWF